ncbi:MAG: conjugative transfer signal peptidase TraF [Rickettsiales bacterium]
MKRPLNILAGIILFVSASIFLLSIIFRINDIYINTTSSFPLGLYKMIDEPVGKDAYVSFCPPQHRIFDMAVERHYINRGNCPGGYGLLLKRVFARAGDGVFIDPTGIKVNDQLLPKSAQLKADVDGFALPQYRLDQRVLDDSEYLLISDLNPNSFDARYFGLINRAQIKHVVEPLFTWSY